MTIALTNGLSDLFLVCIMCVLLGLSCFSGVPENVYVNQGDHCTLSFIDVGYGDATVIIAPNQDVYVVDGGETGKEVMAYLNKHHIKNIKGIISTHPHFDHIRGLVPIVAKFNVETIYLNPPGDYKEIAYDELIYLAKEKNIPVKSIFANDYIVNEAFKIMCVYPKQIQKGDPNFNSVVLRVDYGDTSALLTADLIPNTQLELMAEKKSDLVANILKIPHHGLGVFEKFVNTVNPKYAVMSIGENVYFAPEKEVVEFLNKNEKIKLFRTDIEGTVEFELYKNKIGVINH